jgi:BirA family transcriptional regulator, biotin operon repressor / biotin---[acetyl-CoA-carboxylase] ligase
LHFTQEEYPDRPPHKTSLNPRLDVVDEGVAWASRHGFLDKGSAQRVRIAARLTGGDWVSGERLAQALGVSRAAVNKHVQLLAARGLSIESEPGSGYRLVSRGDSLVPEAVLPLLLDLGFCAPGTDRHVGLPYRYEQEVSSTNVVAKELAQAGAPGGALVVSERQTAGRGRLERVWQSEPGKDLTFSVLLRSSLVPGEANLMMLAAALAVADVVAEVPGLRGRVGIKWPNDVLLDGGKVAGILAEASIDMDVMHWVVIGIGLNVNGDSARLVPAETRAPGQAAPVSLARLVGGTLDRPLLLARLARELSRRWAQVTKGRRSEILDAYAALDALLGGTVTVRSGIRLEQVVAEGVASGLGAGGELLLREKDGSLREVVAGEVSLAPR